MTNVIAHRGASRAERENTREAFTAAVRMGAAGIELDARRTADGAIVVNHDARLPDGREIVACQRVDLPGHVLTLGEALDACAGAFVNIEIKNDPAEPDFDESESVAEGVVALLASRAEPITNWIISSFRIESVDRCRHARARAAHGVVDVPAGDVRRHRRRRARAATWRSIPRFRPSTPT